MVDQKDLYIPMRAASGGQSWRKSWELLRLSSRRLATSRMVDGKWWCCAKLLEASRLARDLETVGPNEHDNMTGKRHSQSINWFTPSDSTHRACRKPDEDARRAFDYAYNLLVWGVCWLRVGDDAGMIHISSHFYSIVPFPSVPDVDDLHAKGYVNTSRFWATDE